MSVIAGGCAEQSEDVGREAPPSGSPQRTCARCGGALDLRTPHIAVEGRTVRAFCSASCLSTFGAEAQAAPPPPPRRRALSRALRLGLGLPMLTLLSGPARQHTPHAIVVAGPPPVQAPAEPIFGPAWPPTEEDWAREIAADAWLHPLDGPQRRMPITDSRVFGAERAGDRPGECVNGHCGVDLSGPWGEPVHASHAGVVDRVQRGPNEDHGGMYVRLAHRDGKIFTQYFHLAAIPRRIQPGVTVQAGEVIGLLGDTGVKHSAAHLHFAISVRPAPSVPERYIDPEPLIALWPLRMPVDERGGVIVPEAPPGVPHGAHHARRARLTASIAASALTAAPSSASPASSAGSSPDQAQ